MNPQMVPGGNGVVVMTQLIPQHNPVQMRPSVFQNGWCQVPPPLERFMKGEPKALGVAQILIGLMEIILGIIIAISSGMIFSIAVIIGIPFWIGLLFIISGSLSTAAERNKSLCLVKGSLGMNIVSSLAALVSGIMYAIDLAICSLSYYGGTQNQEFDDDVSRALAATLVAVVKGIEGLLLVLMVVEFCISISTSVFGCKAVCRDSNADMAVIIQHNHPSVQASCPTVVPAPPPPPPPMYHLEDQFYFA